MHMRLRVAWHETSYFVGRHVWLFAALASVLALAAVAHVYRDRILVAAARHQQSCLHTSGPLAAIASALCCCMCCLCCCRGTSAGSAGKRGESGAGGSGPFNLERRIV